MAQQEKNIANGKDQKILQHDIEEIDKKVDVFGEASIIKDTKQLKIRANELIL